MRPFTYMYACRACSLSSHSPSLLPLRGPSAHRRLTSRFFSPSNYHSKENIFLSNLGVMLFQVWVMNKLVQTLHVSVLMQKDHRLRVGGCCRSLGEKDQHQVSQQRWREKCTEWTEWMLIWSFRRLHNVHIIQTLCVQGDTDFERDRDITTTSEGFFF